jgi:hypothetical protein
MDREIRTLVIGFGDQSAQPTLTHVVVRVGITPTSTAFQTVANLSQLTDPITLPTFLIGREREISYHFTNSSTRESIGLLNFLSLRFPHISTLSGIP